MYKYFRELDNPNNFTTLYKTYNSPKIVPIFQFNLRDIPIDVLENLKYVLAELSTIDLLVSQQQLIFIPDEEQIAYSSFQNYLEDNSPFLEMIKKKINITNNDLLDLLQIYQQYISILICLYHEHKDYLNELNKKIKKLVKFMEAKCWIEIPVKPVEQVIWPNNWYITPHGYLYNACTGDKKGGSLYDTLNDIFAKLGHNKNVIEDFKENITQLNLAIRDIENGKFVTFDQFYNYTKFTEFPSSDIPELECLNYSTIYNIANNTIETITTICCQKNIRTIVLGYLDAQLALYEYYLYLYKQISYSPNYSHLIVDLHKSESDILLKFCGFHRIEPYLEKTITTSSIDSLSNFSLYEENDWNIKIVPPIEYDKEKDALVEGKLNELDDKIKILLQN